MSGQGRVVRSLIFRLLFESVVAQVESCEAGGKSNLRLAGNMGDVDEVRDNLLEKLQTLKDVNDLKEICGGLSVSIPLAKQGKVSAIRSLLVRYLTSETIEESDDEGLALYQDVLKQVETRLAAKGPPAVKVEEKSDPEAKSAQELKSEASSSSAKPSAATPMVAVPITKTEETEIAQVTTRVEHLRLNKEFKLGGVVGSGKNCLGYGTIYYRMQDAKLNGYKTKEILSGVVRAMQPGSELQQYFEGHPEMEEEEFMAILQNHF